MFGCGHLVMGTGSPREKAPSLLCSDENGLGSLTIIIGLGHGLMGWINHGSAGLISWLLAGLMDHRLGW